ncbi:Phage terminase-like protein%2C large subunit [Chlamydia trachomatis]|nr:Phage terminase-like protein%2C large subunit [Chlamydia trachomatis]CRH89862.1 Phage terminase-like protein%2C large subunit [Chlamydia trachomatis]
MPWQPLDEYDEFPTLGYDVADWMTSYLLQPDIDDSIPFVPTQEQLDFLVDLYEIDPQTCKRVKSRAVLSRPRGWGKSPFLAAICCVEAMGPVLCDGWDADGQPVGIPWARRRTPLVQVTATTDDQTANTWTPLLEMLRGSDAEDEYGVEAMDSFVTMRRGKIEKRTSSATSVKGARAVMAVLDQTETWLPGNGGPKLAKTLRNNATKLGGVTIETPNAYTIGERSVAETTARFAELVAEGKVKPEAARRLLYSHREAPLNTDISNRESLIEGLRIAYGDASGDPRGCLIHEPACTPGWVDVERTADDFWEPDNDPAEMCADFLNQINSASDAWLTMPELRAIEDSDKTISSHEPITLGFDGSEGRKIGIADATVLIGYSITQKHLFKVGIWSQPDGPKGEGWQPPRLEIEQKIRETFERFNVVGFYADPSAGWAQDVKMWEARYSKRLKAKISANEPIRYPQRNVTATCENFAQLLSAIRQEMVTYDGDPTMTAHFLNARKSPRQAGYVLVKPADDQDYSKIDATWGAMFAYKAGLDAVGKGASKPKRHRAPRRIR